MNAETRDEDEAETPRDREPVRDAKKRSFCPYLLVTKNAESYFDKTADQYADDEQIPLMRMIFHDKDKETHDDDECGQRQFAESSR